MLAVIYPVCPCSFGLCGDRIPVFEWAGGVKPTAADMDCLADDIVEAIVNPI